MEEWKNYPLDVRYQVSNYGNVKGQKGNILKGSINNAGYKRIGLYSDGKAVFKFVHRMVMETFSPCANSDDLIVNHKDGNKLNNNVDNLEWVTPSENQKHRQKILGKTKTSQRKIGKFNKNHVLIEEYPSIVDAAKSFGKSRVNIDNALQGKQKTAYGFIWEYLD